MALLLLSLGGCVVSAGSLFSGENMNGEYLLAPTPVSPTMMVLMMMLPVMVVMVPAHWVWVGGMGAEGCGWGSAGVGIPGGGGGVGCLGAILYRGGWLTGWRCVSCCVCVWVL